MAQDSIFWTTNGSGDGADEYTQDDVTNWLLRSFGDGVLYGYGGNLAIGTLSTFVTVVSGAANIYGTPYVNDADMLLNIPTVSLGATGVSVVLQKDWANQEVRVKVISSADGVSAIPTPVNNPGTTYELQLATFTVSPPQSVSNFTDTRPYAVMNTSTKLRGLVVDRQGGSATSWSTGGTTNYTSTRTTQLFGTGIVNDTTVPVAFVRQFSQVPMVFFSMTNNTASGSVAYTSSVTTSGFVLNASVTFPTLTNFFWMAIGRE